MAGLCSRHHPNLGVVEGCDLCHASPADLFPDWEERLAEAKAAGLHTCERCSFEYYQYYFTSHICPLCCAPAPVLALVIDESVRTGLRAIAAAAAADPTPLETLLRLRDRELQPESVSAGKTLDVPMGFHVVLTHEHHPGGLLRHLSVSVILPGRVPHPEAVRMIMQEVGFVLPLEECIWWDERCGPDKTAINVVEPLDGDWTPHRELSS